jgi:outer membrane biosynthesis protein TonB
MFERSRVRGRLARRVSWLVVAMLLGVALFAPTAVMAHNARASLTCEGGLDVFVDDYYPNGTNTIAISIDGVPIDGSPFTFGITFAKTVTGLAPTEPHTALIVISAWDDPTGAKGWSQTIELSIVACVEPTPTPTATATQAPTPTPTEAPTPTPTATPTQAPTPTPTATPTEAPTPTPTPQPTESTRPTPTPTPQPTESTQPTPTPTATPSGSVEGATGTPNITLPPTDALSSGASSNSDGWRLALVALAGILTAALLLTRAGAVIRRERD